MSEASRALADLLRRERAAALQADVEALEVLQEEKRELLARVEREGGIDGPTFEHLAEVAKANLVLIRQLVALHRALAGLAPGGYGADGREQSAFPPPSVRRGVL